MATGGTIPANRTQSITFYNTTGIIDREKNIYLAPRTSKYSSLIGYEIRSVFLNVLQTVCPPSSAYKNIDISQWSPQDRTLKVKGNVDDFRLITDEGDCLNYFILHRGRCPCGWGKPGISLVPCSFVCHWQPSARFGW